MITFSSFLKGRTRKKHKKGKYGIFPNPGRPTNMCLQKYIFIERVQNKTERDIRGFGKRP